MNKIAKILITSTVVLFLSSCDDSSTNQVSFTRQVKPILATHCLSCHTSEGEGFKKSGLNMETYETLMKGTKFGPVIVPGNALSSSLVILIEGKADPAIKMPHGSLQMIPEQERKTIKQWIQQGAKNN
ncbi:c-type cytochrome domain-containing protein [Kaarinaea lacus]